MRMSYRKHYLSLSLSLSLYVFDKWNNNKDGTIEWLIIILLHSFFHTQDSFPIYIFIWLICHINNLYNLQHITHDM